MHLSYEAATLCQIAPAAGPVAGPGIIAQDHDASDGDPGGTRTPYLQIRNLSLYPDELRDHTCYMPQFTPERQMQRAARLSRQLSYHARGADSRGVDIIQNCEVTGFRIEHGVCVGVETSRGFIGAKKVAATVAGSSGRLMAKAGLRLPIESHVLQAFVSEGLKPVIPGVITFGAGHFYISQSDKGGLVFGASLDGYNTYAQRGNLPLIEHVMEAGVSFVPAMSKVRLLRSWGGVMDMSPDGSPIIDKTPIDGLYLNAGWCYGGFKATPASGYCYAHLLARDEPHQVATEYRLDRFMRGAMIDEKGVGAQPNLH